jgi:outer membrane protein assembly factor BamB
MNRFKNIRISEKILFFLMSLQILMLLGCEPKVVINPDTGDVKPLWSRLMSDQWIYGYISKPFARNDLFLATGNFQGNEYLAALSPIDGELIWKQDAEFGISIFSHHYYNDNLLYDDFRSGTVLLNLKNGTTTSLPMRIDNIMGLDTLYFCVGAIIDDNEVQHYFAYYGDVFNYQFTPFLNVDHLECINPDSWLGCYSIWNVYPYYQNNSIYLLVNYELHYPAPEYYTTAYVGLFNFTDREWIWKDTEVNAASGVSRIQGHPLIDNGFAYQVNHGISCIDLGTGEVKWKYRGVGHNWWKGLVVYNDFVIGYQSGFLTALDKRTGSLIWKSKEMGFADQLSEDLIIHNGIFYFIGGATLYAIDLTNFEILWEIRSPDEAFDIGGFFRSELSLVQKGDGEKDLLITHTYRGVHACQTIR